MIRNRATSWMFVIGLCFGWVLAAGAQGDRGIGGAAGAPSGAGSGRRVALVMGNGAYANAPLRNPVNDATDVAAALRTCGFDVIAKTDCTYETMDRAVLEFGQRVAGGEVALFFYAGHGLQVNGQNYLVPVDADVTAANEVKYRCINAGLVLAKMESAGTSVNIIILDACRNNPFARSFRSNTLGLAEMSAAKGSIISYATAPGDVAADGDGRNGLYTQYLLQYIQTPGLELRDVFMQSRIAVAKATNDRQIPWENSSLMGRFYFLPPAPSRDGPEAPPPPEAMVMTGHLQVNVNAPNARVLVDGVDIGTAGPNQPVNREGLPSGEVSVTVSAQGFEPETRRVAVERDQWAQEAFELARIPTMEERPGSAPSQPLAPEPELPEGLRPRKPSSAIQGSTPGETRGVNLGDGVTLDLVWIPPGRFTMGSPKGEKGRHSDEGPCREVTLSQGFWMGKYEVTCRQWVAVMGGKPPSEDSADRPVVHVTRHRAREFASALSKKIGEEFRLPTEAQWEYACRAGTTTAYHFGENAKELGEYAWYSRNFGGASFLFGARLKSVGQKKPNPWGLYDMHGNAAEWCEDVYDYSYPPGPATDPLVRNGTRYGVLRSAHPDTRGSGPACCRAAYRDQHGPGVDDYESGLRICGTGVRRR